MYGTYPQLTSDPSFRYGNRWCFSANLQYSWHKWCWYNQKTEATSSIHNDAHNIWFLHIDVSHNAVNTVLFHLTTYFEQYRKPRAPILPHFSASSVHSGLYESVIQFIYLCTASLRFARRIEISLEMSANETSTTVATNKFQDVSKSEKFSAMKFL